METDSHSDGINGLCHIGFTLGAQEGLKTSLDGHKVLWLDGDGIGVFDSQAQRRFSIHLSESAAYLSGEALKEELYTLVYPYSGLSSKAGSDFEVCIPEVQTPVEGGFDSAAALMAAVAPAGNDVLMKNVCGLLRFSITSSDICAVRIATKSGEGISGLGNLSFMSDTPILSGALSDYVLVQQDYGKTFAPGIYHICLAPVHSQSGLDIRIFRKDGSAVSVSYGDSFTIQRNTISVIPTPLNELDAVPFECTESNVALTASHPRLFATDAEFEEYRNIVLSGRNRALTLMHYEVVATARRSVARAIKLSTALDASGKRMLEMARNAFGQIFMCAYAYRFTGERCFLDEAVDLLTQICNFKDWNKQNHYLDTSTLTHAAAVGYDWLYDCLPEDLRRKLEIKVFEYSLGSCLTDAAGYINPNSGWNTTITSGMILGGIAFYDANPALCRKLIATAVPSNYKGLRHLIAVDGSDPMGSMYWRNFIQMEMLSVSALKSAYGTDFGTSEYEGYLKTSEWYLHLIGNTGYTFSYGDNNESTDLVPTMFYHSVLAADPSIPYWEMKASESGSVLTGGIRTETGTAVNARTYPLILLWTSRYETSNVKLPAETVYDATAGAQTMVLARAEWDKESPYLAIKGGQANLNHSHMDAGSICYEAGGLRWVGDPIQDEYDAIEKAIKDTGAGDLWDRSNGSARYKCFRINARQHSTFIINDTDHEVNGDARFTAVYKDEDCKGGTVDLTSTMNGQTKKALRTAVIRDGAYLEVTDEISSLDAKPAEVRWNFYTEAIPEITAEGITLTLAKLDPNLGTVKMTRRARLSVSCGYPVEYVIYSSDPKTSEHPSVFAYAEEVKSNEHYCGFRIKIPAGETGRIVTTIKLL